MAEYEIPIITSGTVVRQDENGRTTETCERVPERFGEALFQAASKYATAHTAKAGNDSFFIYEEAEPGFPKPKTIPSEVTEICFTISNIYSDSESGEIYKRIHQNAARLANYSPQQ